MVSTLSASSSHVVWHPAGGQTVEALEQALALSWQIVRDAQVLALALSDLGDIDLPPSQSSEADRSHLQVTAPLYLAAELELASLLPAVETFAGIIISGGLHADLEKAAPLVIQFWQERHQRFTVQERQAIFARLFGTSFGPNLAVPGGRNTAFEPLTIDLTEALYKLDPAPLLGSRAVSEIPLRLAARRLAANLIPRSGGMAAFAAQELLRSLDRALAILKQPSVQQAVGANSVWMALCQIARRYLNTEIDVATHVAKGRAGMQVLAWLAEVLPHLDDDAIELVSPRHPVIAAAAAWLESSLTLAEQGEPVISGGA